MVGQVPRLAGDSEKVMADHSLNGQTNQTETIMGLTIHYSFESRARSEAKARQLVEKMRQICMDLAFSKVCDVQEFRGNDCDYNNPKYQGHEATRWLLIQASQSVTLPWTKSRGENQTGECHVDVAPSHIIACNVWGLDGSEPMNVGLCRYPREIEWEYDPEDDARFRSHDTSWHGFRGFGFDSRKWRRYCDRKGYQYGSRERFTEHWKETRKVKTGLGSKWYWSSFCKTQYASDPACGGIPNFLRAHISTITALERIAELPTLTVSIDDEGDYGRNYSCPDWAEADAEGRERVYQWFEGHHDPAKLADTVGEWNQMGAAFFGAMNDALKASDSELGLESPISQFSNFERLEHFGRMNANDNRLGPFLKAMGSLAAKVADANTVN